MADLDDPRPEPPSIAELPTLPSRPRPSTGEPDSLHEVTPSTERGDVRGLDPREVSPLVRAMELARTQALLGLEPTPPRFGRFTVLETLGRGGMGVVIAAHDPQLDRRVALKLLDEPGTEDSAAAREAVLREARSLARLSHPNVVGVYEVGEVDEQPFIAMELVEGTTLSAWLREPAEPGGAPPGRLEVLQMFLAVAEGLAAAHEAGIVHRDFKPDNVLVGLDGRPRILDFGLSRVRSRAPDDEAVPPEPRAEPVTTAAGTPAYMAPEQWLREAVDARADVFSFCVALFESLYGVRPFGGETLLALMEQVTTAEPRAIAPAERVATPLHAAILRGLARDPDERWSSMEGLAAVLRETLAQAQPGLLATPPSAALRSVGALNLLIPAGWLALELLGVVPYRALSWLWVSTVQILVLTTMIVVIRRRLLTHLRSPRLLVLPLVFIPLLLGHRVVTLVMGSSVEAMFVFDYLIVAAVAWVLVLLIERGVWPVLGVGLTLVTLGALQPEWAPRLWVAFVMITPATTYVSAMRAVPGRNRAILGASSQPSG